MLLESFSISGNSVYYLKHKYLDFPEQINTQNPIHRKILLDEGVILPEPPKIKSNNSDQDILVIEPHLDDCAISCSGYVIDAVMKGKSVTLLNIFSRATLDTFPWRNVVDLSEDAYNALRFQESETFSQYLGLKLISLRYPQAMARGHKSPFESPFQEDERVTDAISKQLERYLSTYKTILCPMAIEHIDHKIAYNAVNSHCSKKGKLILYEDYPYAGNKITYNQRVLQISDQIKTTIHLPLDKIIEVMATSAIIYRSQFDDINRSQMLAVFQDRFRNVTRESLAKGFNLEKEFYQRYYEVK